MLTLGSVYSSAHASTHADAAGVPRAISRENRICFLLMLG